jgi:ABC-type phosphate transport system auxiliary subunit
MSKVYKVFTPEDELDKFKGREGKVFTETVMDEETREAFQADIMVSQSPQEGYEELLIQARGGFLPGKWFVKILKREEEKEEAVTVFEAKRLGERRGYMLRSMMAEEKAELKKETMTTELEKRMKRRQEIVKDLLKGKE